MRLYSWYKNKCNVLTITQRIELLENLLAIFEIVYGENLLSVNREFYEINRVIACLQLLEKQYEAALDKLEMAAEYAIAFDAYKDGDSYTSLMMYGISADEHSLWDEKATDDMVRRLTNQSRYECLKNNVRYENIIKKLSKRS